MDPRQLPEDFKEFISSLNSNNVRYLLVGGWAVAIYGYPRVTKDIDFIIAIDDENLERFRKTLLKFGAPRTDMAQFKKIGYVFRMGRPPVQIDIINQASGIDFDECYPRRELVKVEDVEISLISRKDLIINKRSSGRTQDLADAEKLE